MIARQMTEAPTDILRSLEHPDYDMAVPTPDHFIPLLYTARLATEQADARALLRGYARGSLSMTCYGVGMDGVRCEAAEGGRLPLRPDSLPCKDLADVDFELSDADAPEGRDGHRAVVRGLPSRRRI